MLFIKWHNLTHYKRKYWNQRGRSLFINDYRKDKKNLHNKENCFNLPDIPSYVHHSCQLSQPTVTQKKRISHYKYIVILFKFAYFTSTQYNSHRDLNVKATSIIKTLRPNVIHLSQQHSAITPRRDAFLAILSCFVDVCHLSLTTRLNLLVQVKGMKFVENKRNILFSFDATNNVFVYYFIYFLYTYSKSRILMTISYDASIFFLSSI